MYTLVCKGYNAQHCLLVMIKKMERARYKNKVCSAVLPDLTKTFDFLSYDFLMSKLQVFGFDCKHIRVMYAHLNN